MLGDSRIADQFDTSAGDAFEAINRGVRPARRQVQRFGSPRASDRTFPERALVAPQVGSRQSGADARLRDPTQQPEVCISGADDPDHPGVDVIRSLARP